MRKRTFIVITNLFAVILIVSLVALHMKPTPVHSIVTAKSTSQSHGAPNPSGNTFNNQAYSTTTASSIWIVVNKSHPLTPVSYVPPALTIPNIPLRSGITTDERQVSAVMAPALESLVAGALNDGVHLNLQSGYRSYGLQSTVYAGYVKTQGQTAADQQSARPGSSEHQTGLAADMGGISNPSCNLEACFATTTEGTWLADHAYRYGFIIRYPADKQTVTGYEFEPWHIRYIGTALSQQLHINHIETLEEYFHIAGGTQYH